MVSLFFVILLSAQTLLFGVESYRILNGEHDIKKRSTNAELQHIVYVGCNENDKISGERLGSIVGYSIKKMNILFQPSNNPSQSYQAYVAALKKSMGAGIPYHTAQEFHSDNVNVILQGMYRAIPMPPALIPQKLKDIMNTAAQKASSNIDTGVHGLGSLFHNSNSASFSQSEFAIMKVFRNADHLEIVPCYMSVRGEKHKKRTLWWVKQWSKANIDYTQMKYTFTKNAIDAIIKAAKLTNWDGY